MFFNSTEQCTDGAEKHMLLRLFNETILYGKKTSELMSGFRYSAYVVPELKRPEFLDEVIELCMHSDIYKRTGLGISELMLLDRATYEQIKGVVEKQQAAEASKLAEIQGTPGGK